MNSGLWRDKKRGLYTTPRSRGPPYRVGKGIRPGSVLPESCREQNGRCVQEKAIRTNMGLKAWADMKRLMEEKAAAAEAKLSSLVHLPPNMGLERQVES